MAFDPSEPRDANGRWSTSITDSLEHQLRGKGHSKEKAHELAMEIAFNNGHIFKNGKLTAKGREREAMGRKARVADRAAKALGRKPEDFIVQRGKAYVK